MIVFHTAANWRLRGGGGLHSTGRVLPLAGGAYSESLRLRHALSARVREGAYCIFVCLRFNFNPSPVVEISILNTVGINLVAYHNVILNC